MRPKSNFNNTLMRKLFILIVLFTFHSYLLGQSEVVSKIGNFKMYDSTSRLVELGFNNIIVIKSIDDLTKNINKSKNKNNIFEYVYDPNVRKNKQLDYPTAKNTYKNPAVRRFVINNLEIIKGLTIESVELIYLNDSLVSFSAYSILRNDVSTIKEIFKTKYQSLDIELNKYKDEDAVLGSTEKKLTEYFKTEYPTVVCAFTISISYNTFGNAQGSLNQLLFRDVEKTRYIKQAESEFETKKVLDTYDIDKL